MGDFVKKACGLALYCTENGASMSDSSSRTPRRPKGKTKRKKTRGTGGGGGGKKSDSSDGGGAGNSGRSSAASGASSGGVSSDSSDAGPSPAELRARAAARAASLSRDLAAKYNKLRHTIEHLKHHLVERRVRLPVVHLLPVQTADSLLAAAKVGGSPKDSQQWVAWLQAWEAEHFFPAEARCHLLLQLKADLRCLSRVLLTTNAPPLQNRAKGTKQQGVGNEGAKEQRRGAAGSTAGAKGEEPSAAGRDDNVEAKHGLAQSAGAQAGPAVPSSLPRDKPQYRPSKVRVQHPSVD